MGPGFRRTPGFGLQSSTGSRPPRPRYPVANRERKRQSDEIRRHLGRCHVDLIWLPPHLFTRQRAEAVKDRMPMSPTGRAARNGVTRTARPLG